MSITFEEYKENIIGWTVRANELGITFSNGKPLHTTIWKNFLGISRSAHTEMMNGTYGNKKTKNSGTVSRSICKTIRYANLLSENHFKSEVELAVIDFEADPSK
jgi:hypothetical protein